MFSDPNLTIFLPCDFWVLQRAFSDPKVRSSLGLGQINRAFSSPLPIPRSLFQTDHNLGCPLSMLYFSQAFLCQPSSNNKLCLFFF